MEPVPKEDRLVPDGTCAHCGAAFVPIRGGQVYCSRRCGGHAAAARRDVAHVDWWVCPDCGLICSVNGQARRKGYRRVQHRCAKVPATRQPICLACMAIKVDGTCPNTRRYRHPVKPHPIACNQCGAVFVGKWTRLCPACKRTSARENARRAKRARRIREGAYRVPYRSVDIYERDGYRCHICGRVAKRRAVVPNPLAPTIDHLVPLSAGGADAPINVATAHFECNWRRGAGGAAQLRLVA